MSIDHFAHLDSDLSESDHNHAPAGSRGMIASAIDARAFIRAGKAVVTLVSKRTGTRFTYSCRLAPDKQAVFIGLLNGPDNTSDYKYLGRIAIRFAGDKYWHGRKSPREGDIGKDAPSAKAFDWAWQALARGIMPDQLEIWHEGRCGRCGRRLTVPASIASGFGPECIGKL